MQRLLRHTYRAPVGGSPLIAANRLISNLYFLHEFGPVLQSPCSYRIMILPIPSVHGGTLRLNVYPSGFDGAFPFTGVAAVLFAGTVQLVTCSGQFLWLAGSSVQVTSCP